jgi:hypothetical protein
MTSRRTRGSRANAFACATGPPSSSGDRARGRRAAAARLQHLSALSRYRRFRAPIARFTRQQLDKLTKLDHYMHEALGALDPVSGEGVGVARYLRDLPTRSRRSSSARSSMPGSTAASAGR